MMNTAKKIGPFNHIIDGALVRDKSYVIFNGNGSQKYRIYLRLDGRWGFMGLAGRSGPDGFATEPEALAAAKRIYGF